MPNPSWIIVLIVGIVLAILGITNMGKSVFMGWMMIVFAACFFLMSYKTWKNTRK